MDKPKKGQSRGKCKGNGNDTKQKESDEQQGAQCVRPPPHVRAAQAEKQAAAFSTEVAAVWEVIERLAVWP